MVEIEASDAVAEGNTNFSVTHDMYDGTLTNAASTDEWYEDAVQLTSNDVGPSADDPLVPIGLS